MGGRKFANPKVKPVTGPPQALISRIDHLHDLLRHLPSSLPENPSHSLYDFGLNADRLEDGGYFAAVGHALEVSFETHLLRIQDRPLLLIERGERHNALVKMLKKGVKNMSPGERITFQEAWIERLITSAIDLGAKIPSKKRKAPEGTPSDIAAPPAKKSSPPIIVVDSSDDEQPAAARAATAPSATASTSTPVSVLSTSPAPQPSSSRTIISNPQQSTLAGFGWKKATPASIAAYWSNAKEAGAERHDAILQAKEEKAAGKKQRERDLARIRKQRERERKKAEADSDEGTAKKSKKPNATTALIKPIPDVADLSRTGTQGWKKDRKGTLGGAIHGPSKKVFWFTPFLWALIEPAIRRSGWSAAGAVADLQRSHPNIFNHLHRGTVWKWIVTGEKRFTDAALHSISNRRSLAGSGRTGILTPYPAIIEEITTILKSLRVSGCVVNVEIARSLMIAIISKHRPELLASFSCSEKYVRSFLDSNLNWSTRKATRAAKHIPDNASELCERTFFRLAHAIENKRIPAKLIINYDQTGVYIRANASQTFEVRGSKQISVAGNDEKRAYTLGVASAADGTLLPLEQIWSGYTDVSLPSKDSDGYQEAVDHGFHFTFAASKKRTSHFTTLKTMKEVCLNVFKPYINSVIESDPDLDEDQKAIVYIDIYPVHTSAAFLDFIAAGVTPENVKFSSSYPVLRNASVRGCVDLYNWLTSPDGRCIVKRSWELCVVPDKPAYNLSYECLTSRETRKALDKYLEEDTILADEIRARVGARTPPSAAVDIGIEPTVEITDGDDVPDDQQDQEFDEIEDDADVPLPEVVDRVLRIRVRNATGRYVARCAIQAEGESGLSAADAEEDIWAYNDQGELWTKAGTPAEESSSEDENSDDENYNPADDD
ncbi:hypothetical protein DFH07DRAFT_777341 [Mycena maculata]|uniref:DDE-1 domain-containing protein n=1 Tax=Mycena maculata TaxID=230809 RepID=A0AAD7II75_9AGAR|nr:hypothetical protein DFH07DRAFT_777341 [Mycena maculata]